MSQEGALADWEVKTITSIRYIFCILSNIYYIMIFIIYIKQRCSLSIKKGIILLMTFTLFTLNILYLFVFYDLIEQRNLNPNMTAPTYCKNLTAIKSILILISNFQVSFIFLYTYIGLYHSEFLVRYKKKICFIYFGLTWVVGICIGIPFFLDNSMIVLSTGDCNPSYNFFTYLYIAFSIIALSILLFSMLKIYLHLRRSEESDDDESKVFKKKLFILGIIIVLGIVLSFFIFSLSVVVSKKGIITCITTSIQIVISLVFVVFYSYDEEFGKTMKEVFLCKKNSIASNGDTIYDELSSKK